MFINYYFPLRAPGGLLAEVYRLSTVYYNFYYTRYYSGGGRILIKSTLIFIFFGGDFYFGYPIHLCTLHIKFMGMPIYNIL